MKDLIIDCFAGGGGASVGITIGIIVGVTGLICVAIMYDKHHPDE